MQDVYIAYIIHIIYFIFILHIIYYIWLIYLEHYLYFIILHTYQKDENSARNRKEVMGQRALAEGYLYMHWLISEKDLPQFSVA